MQEPNRKALQDLLDRFYHLEAGKEIPLYEITSILQSVLDNEWFSDRIKSRPIWMSIENSEKITTGNPNESNI